MHFDAARIGWLPAGSAAAMQLFRTLGRLFVGEQQLLARAKKFVKHHLPVFCGPRLSGGNASTRIDEATGTMPPPAKPCMMRNSSRDCRVQAMPHSTELAVNSARQIRKKVLRPSVLAKTVLTVRLTALATR
jgi:hypothetical protein